MERTPKGTPVGVDDPYAHAGACDHVTGEGTCRFAFDRPQQDPTFARERRAAEYACPVAEGAWEWSDCPHYRCRATGDLCRRCGIEERRMAHDGDRPLLEEHHLAYPDDRSLGHEITVLLCRWCHAKVHGSWARITDDAAPDPEALAALEGRRSRELEETAFRSARERWERQDD
ncbi:MAG: hypothetical protein R3324_03195 [Halobacteriales archaeon]|nr:hypothetical protein [Halobacteriales archaeon]